MASDDFDLDDFDFEDFEIDIPDFDVENAKDDRKPVEKLRSGFFEGAKQQLTSVDNLEQTVKLALPEGYSAAFNAKDTAVSTVKELYHTAATELKPVTTAVKNSIKKISPNVKEKLPKFIQNRIEEIQNEVEYNQQSAAAAKREGEENQIASVMQEIFKTQLESEQTRHNEEKAETMVQKTIETNQRNSLIESANIVAKGMDRVVGYQDNILSKFHQKSLELQFRQYFVAKDLLDLTSVHQGKIEEALATITKNTALPEAVKIEKSELAGQLIKERLLNSTIDGIAGFASRYRDKFMGNAKNFIGGVTGSIGMGASMAGTMPEGMDKSSMAGEMLGSLAGQYASEWLAREAGERIKDNDLIKRGNAKLLNLFSPGGMSRKISAWGRSETKGDSWLSLGTDMLKSLVPQFYANDKVRDNPMFTSDKPAIYDQLARRSLTEIIPTYLSQIAHWTKATATGVIDGDMEVYSLHRGGMTTKSNMLEDVKRAVMPRRENVLAKNEIDAFIGKMFEGQEISDDAKSALRRQILVDINSNQTFDPRRYAKYEGFKDSKGSEDAIDELNVLFRDKFMVDEDGEYTSDETDDLMTRTQNEQSFNRLANVMPTPDTRIRALVDAVGMDALRELGMIKRVNREDKIDYDKITDLILSDKEDESAEPYSSIFDQTTQDKSFLEALKEKARKLAAGEKVEDKGSDLDEVAVDSQSKDQLAAISKIKGGKSAGRSLNDIKVTGIQARVDELVMDPYLGAESPVIRELKNIQSLLKAQVVPEVKIDGSIFQESNEYQKAHSEYLEAILDTLRTLEFGGAPQERGSAKDTLLGGLNSIRNSRFGRGVGWGKDKLIGAAGSYLRGTRDFYKKLGSGSWSLGKLGFKGGIKGIEWGGKKLFEREETGDILVLGRRVPALRKSLIEAGEYIDVRTNKVITSFKDITGEVRDKAGNLILGEEDYKKGLVDGTGKPLILRIGKRAFDFASKLLTPYRMAWDLLVGAKDYVKRKVEELSDGYLKGEKIPRLKARIMKEGGYFDQSTGNVIKSFKDITGNIVDAKGNIVATIEEIRESGGFFNAVGERIKETSGKLFRGIGGGIAGMVSGFGTAVGSVFKAYGAIGRGIGSAIGGIGSAIASPFGGFGFGGPQADKLVSLNYAQTVYQAEILKVLLQGRGRGRGKSQTSIDESWRNINVEEDSSSGGTGFSNPFKKLSFDKLSLKNPLKGFSFPSGKLGEFFKGKKEKVLEEKDKRMAQVLAMISENQMTLKDRLEGAKKKVFGDTDGDGVREGAWWTRKRKGNLTTQTKEKEKEKKSGIFGLLSAALPMMITGLTFIGNKIAGLANALGLAKLAGGLLGKGPDIGDVAGAGKKGLLRRGAGALARGAWAATKFAGGMLGRAAGFALFKAVPAVATALASVVSAPVLLGAAAGAGVAYVGYKIYKHYTTDSGPIFRLRMNQYGFAPGDKGILSKIAKLEEMHWKNLTYLNGKVTVNSQGIDFEEMASLFDIDLEDTSDAAKERFQTWLHWYKERFSPVFKTHAGAIKSMGEGYKLETFESEIKPEKALEIVHQVKMSDYSNAFNDMTSPFEGDSLTQDSEAVKKAIEEAIEYYKEKTGKDKKVSVDPFEKTTRGIEAATAASPLQKAAVASNGSSDIASTGPGKIGVFKGAALLATGMVLAPVIVAGRVMGLFDKEYGKLTAGQVVRLKSYGLTTLESGKVNLLLSMEERAIKDIKFDGQRRGIWAGVDDDYLDRYGSRFGVSTPDDKARWIRWFSGRFLPVLVQYATSVKTRVNVPLQEAESRIRGNTLKTVLGEVIGATAFVDGTSMPIWHVTDSPWPDYALNTDRSSAEKTVEAIEAVNDVHGDILGEDKKVKPKGVEDVDTKKEDEKGFLTKFSEKLSTAASNAYHSAKDSIGGAFSAVSNAASNAVNAVSNAVSSVIPSSSGAMGKVGNPSENRDAVIKAMIEAGITDPKEQASFMAQLDHESGGFKVLRENLNYRASRLKEVFSRYRNNPAAAERDAGNPEAIANMVYGNRSDLGNTEPGDGWKYRGRGFIQLTGRDNFTRASRDLGIDLVNNPDLAETPEIAAKLAIWYWKRSNAGAAARAGDLRASRKAVNGGYNGMADVQGKFNTYLSQALAGKFAPSGEKPAGADGETAVAANTPAATETTPATTPATPAVAATGLTTPTPTATSTPVAVTTAPVASSEAVSSTSVPVPVVSAPSPELKARVADVQSSNVDNKTDQQLAAVSSILERQLAIQSSMDSRLAQVVELLKSKGDVTPQPGTVQAPSARVTSASPAPMPRTPVSVGRYS